MNGGKRPASKQNRLREVVEKGWDDTIIGVKGVALQVCVLVHDRDERCRGVRWKFGDRLLLKRTRKRKCQFGWGWGPTRGRHAKGRFEGGWKVRAVGEDDCQ